MSNLNKITDQRRVTSKQWIQCIILLVYTSREDESELSHPQELLALVTPLPSSLACTDGRCAYEKFSDLSEIDVYILLPQPNQILEPDRHSDFNRYSDTDILHVTLLPIPIFGGVNHVIGLHNTMIYIFYEP
jgi:hypothetical protein